MVRKSRARSSSLFLMELILAILFFSVASAVCVQFFIRSHLLSRDSDALNHAVSECSGIAELVAAVDGATEAAALLKELYPDCKELVLADAVPADDAQPSVDMTLGIYYSESFEPCAEAAAAYLLTLRLTEEAQMLDASMRMTAYVPGTDAANRSDANSEDDSAMSGSASGTADTSLDAAIYELTVRHHIAQKTGNR